MTSRQQFICDIVEMYKKNNRKEYKQYLKEMKDKRKKLKNPETARFLDKEGRHTWKIPENLYNALNMLDNPRFLNDGTGGEGKWFAKKYPEFLVPYEI